MVAVTTTAILQAQYEARDTQSTITAGVLKEK
jgi:hypothetical protein